jgi:quercetin dioxygenase-like cupin family protein
MTSTYFPPFIRALPPPASLLHMDAHMVPSDHVVTMFYEVDDDMVVAEHAHGAQWGVILAGEMEMVISGESRIYRSGDTYYVPPGAPHLARIRAGYKGIDVFADADRYTPAETEPR